MGKIITVSREFGSGGRAFSRKLAEILGYEYYDKEIITEISKHTELSEDFVRNIMHSRPHALYPITVGRTLAYSNDNTFQQMQSVFSAHSDIINELAEKSNCVIVGRCADYILKNKNPYRIFVYADIDYKIKRCLEREDNTDNLNEKQMKKHIESVDAQRAKFYNFYTGDKWGETQTYDLMINSAKNDMNKMAEVVASLLKD